MKGVSPNDVNTPEMRALLLSSVDIVREVKNQVIRFQIFDSYPLIPLIQRADVGWRFRMGVKSWRAHPMTSSPAGHGFQDVCL